MVAPQVPIQMVDLSTQTVKIREALDQAMNEVLESSAFINGPQVARFARELEAWTGATQVIPCANGTDALQLALMALNLAPGDEIITPAFSYAATAEVIALLGLKPVLVDADPGTFLMDVEAVRRAITPRTRVLLPVHLFGQITPMEPLLELAEKQGLYVVEDNAQAIGAVYTFTNGMQQQAGTIGHLGCTSFFPSKNLGCFGDGGAVFAKDPTLGERAQMLANHGQRQKYHHELVGVNSRLDSLQAAVLSVKLKHLDAYIQARQSAAAYYDLALTDLPGIHLPERVAQSTHVFHQYTLRVEHGRDALRIRLKEAGIPTMVYYPQPLHLQPAYRHFGYQPGDFPVAEALTAQVLSLPMHTELSPDQLGYITHHIKKAIS